MIFGGDPLQEARYNEVQPYLKAAKFRYYQSLLNKRLGDEYKDDVIKFNQGKLELMQKLQLMKASPKDVYEATKNFNASEANLNKYLTPEQIKETIGDRYDDFLQVANDMYGENVKYYGDAKTQGVKEGNVPIEKQNWGVRWYNMPVTNAGSSDGYTRRYVYDPSKGYDVIEEGDKSKSRDKISIEELRTYLKTKK